MLQAINTIVWSCIIVGIWCDGQEVGTSLANDDFDKDSNTTMIMNTDTTSYNTTTTVLLGMKELSSYKAHGYLTKTIQDAQASRNRLQRSSRLQRTKRAVVVAVAAVISAIMGISLTGMAAADQVKAAQDTTAKDTVKHLKELLANAERTNQGLKSLVANSEQTNQRLQVLSNSSKLTNEELKEIATSSGRTNQRLKDLVASSERTNQQMTDLLKSSERTNEELRAISATNKRIENILDGFNAKLDAFSKKLDRLISATHDISNTITITSMKKDFDILFNARQMLRRQKLVKGIHKPAFLFRYKNPNDFKEIRRALININSYLTERRAILNNKNFAQWLIDGSTTCRDNQYAQLLAVQGATYEWWKVLTVALCQMKVENRKKNIGWCHAESAEILKGITEFQLQTMKEQQEAVNSILPQYMFTEKVSKDKARCAIRMGAILPNKNAEETWNFLQTIDMDKFTQWMRSGKTPLSTAAHLGYLDAVKYLVSLGADVNEKRDGWAPIIQAALSGHLEIVKYLVENGASVNEESGGWAPIHQAANNGHLEIVKYLVENGASVNEKSDKWKWAPIHYAAEKGHLEIVKYLVENGASVNTMDDSDGFTALHRAATDGHLQLTKYLVSKGANINARARNRNNGWSVLQWVRWNGRWDVYNYLRSIGAIE